jgi:hypothetical protein
MVEGGKGRFGAASLLGGNFAVAAEVTPSSGYPAGTTLSGLREMSADQFVLYVEGARLRKLTLACNQWSRAGLLRIDCLFMEPGLTLLTPALIRMAATDACAAF